MAKQQWFYLKRDQRLGPISARELKQLASAGQLQATDLVWRAGMAAWTQARVIKGLGFDPALSLPPPVPFKTHPVAKIVGRLLARIKPAAPGEEQHAPIRAGACRPDDPGPTRPGSDKRGTTPACSDEPGTTPVGSDERGTTPVGSGERGTTRPASGLLHFAIHDGEPLAAEHFPLTPGQGIDYWYTLLPCNEHKPIAHLLEREEWHPGGLVTLMIRKHLVEIGGRIQKARHNPATAMLMICAQTLHRRLRGTFIEERCDFFRPKGASFEPILKLGAEPGDRWEFVDPKRKNSRFEFLYLGHHAYRDELAAVVACTEYSEFRPPQTKRRYYVKGKGLVYQEWETDGRISAQRSRIVDWNHRLPTAML